MRKLAISLCKGGVGKSSTAVSIAHGLARKDRRVLLIDTDDQGQDAFLLGVKPEMGLAEVFIGHCSIDDAITPARDNLWLLAGAKALSGIKMMIGSKEFGRDIALSDILEPLDGKYDYVLIDTSPSWDMLTINSLFYANEVLSPVSTEVLSLISLREFSNRLESIQKHRRDVKLSHAYILPTFLDGRVKKSQEVLDQIKDHYGDRVCHPVRYNVKLSESAGYGQTIYEFAPTSPGAKDYQKTVERILLDEQKKHP